MSTIILFTIFITISVSLSISSRHDGGFSVNLIHRDSPLSPLYNPTHSLIDRNRNAFLRSMSRHSESFAKADADMYAEYIMKFGIGSPPVEVFGSVSISSDLSWTPCEPCKTCYKRPGVHFFVPASSSTYQAKSCRTKACKSLDNIKPLCDTRNDICHYDRAGRLYYTQGVLARDTFWIGPAPFKQVSFGCAHDYGEIPDDYAESMQYFSTNMSGLIGLGGGPLSLVNQIKPAIQGKFSYCLMPRTSSQPSKIYFGELFNMSGPTVVSTSLTKTNDPTIYTMHLFDVLVGNKSVSSYNHNHNQSHTEKVNMIIDIDSVYATLPTNMYNPVIAAITKAIGNADVFTDYLMCYKNLSLDRVPVLTLRFTGADVEVPPTYMFMEIRKGVSCLAIIESIDYAYLGTLFQTNLMVGFDLLKQKVYFKPNCAIR